tara:strand:- start:5358 stop:5699 length:342 start_codon:yes stop_codon:yes gene_type:complete
VGGKEQVSVYHPDKWMLIKIGGTDPHYRVFGSWSGGYASSDSWRMNSGITKVTEDERNFYFNGHSGSIYVCYKGMYGANVYGHGVAAGYEDGTLFRIIKEEPKDIMNIDWIIK